MALPTVKEVILKLADNPEFRQRFRSNEEMVMAEFDLTEEEKECLRGISDDQIASLAFATTKEQKIKTGDIRC